MNTKESISKNYIFKENTMGELTFEGKFEQYYQECDDPWNQSGQGNMLQYYSRSRKTIAKHLNNYQIKKTIEVGCGLGYACNELSKQTQTEIEGIDISTEAISQAIKKFPNFDFFVGDITNINFKTNVVSYQCVLLNQLLWYILEDLQLSINNSISMLETNGLLIISNAFAREQRYGKNIIDGFDGAFKYFNNCSPKLKLIHAEFNDSNNRVIDGIFVLKKIA